MKIAESRIQNPECSKAAVSPTLDEFISRLSLSHVPDAFQRDEPSLDAR